MQQICSRLCATTVSEGVTDVVVGDFVVLE
jgi:hypothetical protein